MESQTSFWLSIDVGIVHLGLVFLEIDETEFRIRKIVWHQLVDIRKLRHNTVSNKECKLGHTSTITDRMCHVYQEYAEYFTKAKLILVERQPIAGLQAVQESLFSVWRDKMELISPNAMHKALHLSDQYEKRKIQTSSIARDYFFSDSNTDYSEGKALYDAEQQMVERYDNYLDKLNKTETRSHDIADAICIALFKLMQMDQRQRKRVGSYIEPILDLEVFRRFPKKKTN